MKHFILQIANPYSEKPSLKFATVPSSYTQVTLKKYFPGMFNYMRKYSVYNETAQAIKAVKDGWVFSFLSEFWVNYVHDPIMDLILGNSMHLSTMAPSWIIWPRMTKSAACCKWVAGRPWQATLWLSLTIQSLSTCLTIKFWSYVKMVL